jgi:hypothetical protein
MSVEHQVREREIAESEKRHAIADEYAKIGVALVTETDAERRTKLLDRHAELRSGMTSAMIEASAREEDRLLDREAEKIAIQKWGGMEGVPLIVALENARREARHHPGPIWRRVEALAAQRVAAESAAVQAHQEKKIAADMAAERAATERAPAPLPAPEQEPDDLPPNLPRIPVRGPTGLQNAIIRLQAGHYAITEPVQSSDARALWLKVKSRPYTLTHAPSGFALAHAPYSELSRRLKQGSLGQAEPGIRRMAAMQLAGQTLDIPDNVRRALQDAARGEKLSFDTIREVHSWASMGGPSLPALSDLPPAPKAPAKSPKPKKLTKVALARLSAPPEHHERDQRTGAAPALSPEQARAVQGLPPSDGRIVVSSRPLTKHDPNFVYSRLAHALNPGDIILDRDENEIAVASVESGDGYTTIITTPSGERISAHQSAKLRVLPPKHEAPVPAKLSDLAVREAIVTGLRSDAPGVSALVVPTARIEIELAAAYQALGVEDMSAAVLRRIERGSPNPLPPMVADEVRRYPHKYPTLGPLAGK